MSVSTWSARSDRERRRARVLGLGLAFCVAEFAAGCGSSTSPAAAATKPGARRSEMADFMKTQAPAKARARPR